MHNTLSRKGILRLLIRAQRAVADYSSDAVMLVVDYSGPAVGVFTTLRAEGASAVSGDCRPEMGRPIKGRSTSQVSDNTSSTTVLHQTCPWRCRPLAQRSPPS